MTICGAVLKDTVDYVANQYFWGSFPTRINKSTTTKQYLQNIDPYINKHIFKLGSKPL